MDDVSFCSYYTCNPILLLEISYIFRCKVTSAGAGIYPTGEKWWKSKYTYNYRTEQYEDEDGNWAEWTEVYDWMNGSGQFRNANNANDFFSGLGYGAPWDGYAMGYVYYVPSQNAIVGRVNDGRSVTVRTINISGGNGFAFQGGAGSDWMGRAGTAFGAGGLVYKGLETLTSNSKFWIDAKGQVRSTSLLERGANGKYVRGVQGLRYSQAAATRAAGIYKVGGNIAGGLGVGITIYQTATGQIRMVEGTIDTVMGLIGILGGPVGAGLSVTYFIGKFAYEEITGSTVFDKPIY